MKTVKEYAFKSKGVVFEIAFAIVQLAFLLFVIIKLFQEPFILLFVGAVPTIFLIFQLYTVYMIFKFNEYDKGKKLIINAERTELILIYNNKTISIDADEVRSVELYEQKSLGKFGSYNYLVIITADSYFIITQFTVPLLLNDQILETFLRKKPRTYFKRSFNFIDEKKFKIAPLPRI